MNIPSSRFFKFSALLVALLFPHLAPALKLQEWEKSNLAAIQTLVGQPKGSDLAFSDNAIQRAEEVAFQQIAQPGFRILELKTRLGICQLMSWYSTEIIKEHREGKRSIDQLLHQLLSPPANDPAATFTIDALRNNLATLGILDENQRTKLSNQGANQLYNLIEAWITFRAIDRLLDGNGAHQYLKQHVSASKKKNEPYEIINYDELSKILFTTKFRHTPLILAYHDGIPSLQNVKSYNTISHIMFLQFDSHLQKWRVATKQEHIVRKSPGLTIKRVKKENAPDSFVMTQDADAMADEADIERIVPPEDGRDYAVVHMGNIFGFNKNFDDSFLHGLGLDRVDFEQMFLRTATADTIPGSLSIFHFNAVKNFDINFFKNLDTYSEPNEAGISLQMGGHRGSRSYSHRHKNHPIAIQTHTYNPWYGELSETPGITVTHAIDGKQLMLRLFAAQDWQGGSEYHFDKSIFARKTKLSFKDCYLAFGTARPASSEDWEGFIGMFKTYLNTDIAPLLRGFLNSLGFTAERRDFWLSQGPVLIQNGIKWTNRTYDTHYSPGNEEEIKRTNKQIPAISAIRQTQLHSGLVVPSQIFPNEASADSLFKIFGISRKKYIERIGALMRNPTTDPYLVNLIEIAMKEHDITRIDEWELTFDNPHLWTTFTHMRILAELYGLQIFLYQLDNSFDAASGEAMFIPLQVEDARNRVIGRGPDEMHIAVVNKHFVKSDRCHQTLQFEGLHLKRDRDNGVGIRAPRPDAPLLPIFGNQSDSEMMLDDALADDTDIQDILSYTLWGAVSGSTTF